MIAAVALALGLAASPEAAVDSIFAPWAKADGPGCSVGVASKGSVRIERAYGMADLEHDVPNSPETIFEAGSVSKQFAAAAVALLAKRGVLGLDDPVRRYVPELPDHAERVTLRQLVHHTSGLRDWGAVAAAAGWPRGSRVHTHAHVLEILARQRALNFPPGEEFLYSNSGYNLLAIVVERASGRSLARLTREAIFEPLGMRHTSWRDDYARVVVGRAQAYARQDGRYRLDMPFEQVYGNSGLLTTVGDLLRWNQNLDAPALGGRELQEQLETRGRLNDGTELAYAFGLVVDEWRGVREVFHTGATAGYRAFLARYPDEGVSLAVLCNAAGADAPALGRDVAAAFLGPALEPEAGPPGAAAAASADLDAHAGLYRAERDGAPHRLVARDGVLFTEDGTPLVPGGDGSFRIGAGRVVFERGEDGRVRRAVVHGPDGQTYRWQLVPDWQPSLAELEAFVGDYASEEADATYRLRLEGEELVLRIGLSTRLALRPSYRDAFTGSDGFVRFLRAEDGRVVGLSLGMERVRDLRFERLD